MKDKDILKKVIEKYGFPAQLMMVVEEIGKLFHLVTCDMPAASFTVRLPVYPQYCASNELFGEVADCLIMIDQLSLMTGQELRIVDIEDGVHIGVIFSLLDQLAKLARGRINYIEEELLHSFYSWLVTFDTEKIEAIRKEKIKRLEHRLESVVLDAAKNDGIQSQGRVIRNTATNHQDL